MDANDLHIRKMNHTDYEVMSKWLSTKEVLEFYGDVHSPFSFEQVKEKYEPRVNGDVPVVPFIVELNREPIAFMQYYKLNTKQFKENTYHPGEHVYGIDQFIGEPHLFNKGIGTIMVRKFIDYIGEHTNADIIILDPNISNVRAIKCYEKCGFRKVKKMNDGCHWLMEIKISA
jgi:aminoglycoside 6'-N-acetyltransferase